MHARDDERGAVAVLAGIVVVILLGMVAMVTDVGALYEERRELQNGADAAALAIARDCAHGLASCAAGLAAGKARDYADANALDGATSVDDVDLDLSTHEVIVETSTLLTGGGTSIAFTFAKVFGQSGSTVRATAAAMWGPPARMATVPLTIDLCEFEEGATLLMFHDPASGSSGTENPDCPVNPANQDNPGGFGWLTSGSGCTTVVGVDDTADADTGNTPPAACDPSDFYVGRVIHLPIYDGTAGSGANATYDIVGFAGFTITGYRLNGGVSAWASTPAPCLPSQTCLAGVFTPLVVTRAPLGSLGNPGNITTFSLTS